MVRILHNFFFARSRAREVDETIIYIGNLPKLSIGHQLLLRADASITIRRPTDRMKLRKTIVFMPAIVEGQSAFTGIHCAFKLEFSDVTYYKITLSATAFTTFSAHSFTTESVA